MIQVPSSLIWKRLRLPHLTGSDFRDGVKKRKDVRNHALDDDRLYVPVCGGSLCPCDPFTGSCIAVVNEKTRRRPSGLHVVNGGSNKERLLIHTEPD